MAVIFCMQRDQYKTSFVLVDNVGKEVVIEKDGVYKFPKGNENEKERIFYRGEHVQYQYHGGAEQYHGFLLGPTKDEYECVTIMDEMSGKLLNDIWPCYVELSVRKDRKNQGLLPKLPSEIMKLAKTLKASGQRFKLEDVFHHCSSDSRYHPARDNFLGGENNLFVP